MALPFQASRDFAYTKRAGEPCRHLSAESRCQVHDDLARLGFRGCIAYDCFGAGQHVAQWTYHHREWRQATTQEAEEMFAIFRVVERLSGILWYAREAAALASEPLLRGHADRLCRLTEAVLSGSPRAVAAFDVSEHERHVGELLRSVSAGCRESYKRRLEHAGADLAGANLRGRDLRGANLRGTCLIGADLRAADFTAADVLGADMRDALVAGADLSRALFLVQSQLEAAIGSTTTRIPDWATPPRAWP